MSTKVFPYAYGVRPSYEKFQARFFYSASASKQGHKGGFRSLGSFKTVDEAAAAVAAATANFAQGGEAAVFDKPLTTRAKRNQAGKPQKQIRKEKSEENKKAKLEESEKAPGIGRGNNRTATATRATRRTRSPAWVRRYRCHRSVAPHAPTA